MQKSQKKVQSFGRCKWEGPWNLNINFMVNPLLFGMQSNAWYFVDTQLFLNEYMYAWINEWLFAEDSQISGRKLDLMNPFSPFINIH